jgi:hypothetical protein
MEPGPAIKGHASDRIVSGKIDEVSGTSLTISSHLGDRKVLKVAPETSITIDGMDGSLADVEEGQPVRASYNQADGQDVAVAIEVGKEPSATEPKELGGTSGSTSGSGSTSDLGSGSGGATDLGSGAGSSDTASEPSGSSGR